MTRLRPLLFALLAASTTPACLVTSAGPSARSAEVATFALAFPRELTDAVSKFDEEEATLDKLLAAEAKLGSRLKTKDQELVRAVWQAADRQGRGAAYAAELRDGERAREIVLGTREVAIRAGSACQSAAKQKGAEVEASGAISLALREALDRESARRLRSSGDAQLLIDRSRGALGPLDAKTLEAQADDVATASYLAATGLAKTRERIAGLTTQAAATRRTSRDFIAEERAFGASDARTEADKKASQERIDAMTNSLAAIDSALDTAQRLERGAERRIEAAKARRDASLKQLLGANR